MNQRTVGYPSTIWASCYIWYSEEGTERGRSPPMPILAVPNVTAHPSTASVPITVLLYSGPLLCRFNVPVKGLKQQCTVDGSVVVAPPANRVRINCLKV